MKCKTIDGTETKLSDAALAGLASSLRGRLVKAGDPDYDATRTIWNAMIDRRPAVFVRCSGAADARRAVDFAREHRLLISIRGGGHHIAGSSLAEGGLVIDLAGMRGVRVDPERKRVRVAGGALLGDVDHETQEFGLATPLGINSTTGVAGLALGGGLGWLTRKHGLTCDNLVGADVVTADGRMIRADAQHEPDLFWALRGGGGNFGVVTSFEFQLHPVGPEVLAGLVVFPFAQARQVLDRYREYARVLPEESNVWVVLRKAPPLPFLPAKVHGKEALVLAVFHAGDPERGRRLFEPIPTFGKPWGEHVGMVPYGAWQQAFDPLLTPGARNYWKSHNFTELSDGLFDTLVDYAGRLPSPHCEIFVAMLGGQASVPAPSATAWAHRDARFVVNVHGRWETAAEDARCRAWSREFFDAAAPFATGGVYVNFMSEDEEQRTPSAYGSNYGRLAELKARYDPENLFRTNQNVKQLAGSRR